MFEATNFEFRKEIDHMDFRIISSSWIKKYNNVTYYTTDKISTYDVSMSIGGHLVHI